MASQHLYLVVNGGYSASGLLEEGWQVGIRLRVSNDEGGDYGDLPTDVTYVDTEYSRDETDWTIVGNFSVGLPALSGFSPDDFLNDQVAPALEAWIGAANMFPNTTAVLGATLYGMTNGDVAEVGTGPAKAVMRFKTAAVPKGASSSTSLPPQCSVVASLMTAVAGRKGKGRIYMPAPPTALVTVAGGLLSSGAATNQATAAAALLDDLTYIDGEAPETFVHPIVTGSPWTKYSKVKAVRCGNVIDTQRRRRNQITETYQQVDLTA